MSISTTEQDLVWVDKELIPKIKECSSVQEVTELFEKNFDKKLKSASMAVNEEMEYLNDSIASLRLNLRKKAELLEKTLNEDYETVEEIVKKANDKQTELLEGLDKTKSIIDNNRQSIKNFQEEIKSLNIYGLEKLLEVMSKFASMGEKEKELFMGAIKYSQAKQ